MVPTNDDSQNWCLLLPTVISFRQRWSVSKGLGDNTVWETPGGLFEARGASTSMLNLLIKLSQLLVFLWYGHALQVLVISYSLEVTTYQE